MKKWNKEQAKTWLRGQPVLNNAVKVLIGIVLICLLIGIVVAAFKFLWSAFVLIGLIVLALLAVTQLRKQGVKIPSGRAFYRNGKNAFKRARARHQRTI